MMLWLWRREDFLKTTVASSTRTQLASRWWSLKNCLDTKTCLAFMCCVECPSHIYFLFKCDTNSSNRGTERHNIQTRMHLLKCSRMWHHSAGTTDVAMPVPADAPRVKGGAGLLGSISCIEGVDPACWGGKYVLLSSATLAHRQMLHTWPQITPTWFTHFTPEQKPLKKKKRCVVDP